MRSLRIWCVLGLVGASLCVNEAEYDGNYADSYDNEISQARQEGESPTTPCQAAEFSRWDKLFIALEDSHMRQNMLLESLEQCCGGTPSLRAQVDELSGGACQRCVPRLEAACGARAEQLRAGLQQSLAQLSLEAAQRERSLNASLRHLLHASQEGSARLKRLEEEAHRTASSGGRDARTGHQPTARPAGATKPLASVLKEQEVTSPGDVAAMRRDLVAIATELHKVHLQLSRLIDQGAMATKDRGDT